MSAKSSRFCARMCSLALARPGMQPNVSLTPPVSRMSWCVLRTPTWTIASASRNALPTGKLRNRRPSGTRQLGAVVLHVHDLHALRGADLGHAADLEGSRDLGGPVEAAWAVGDEGHGPRLLEPAQHAAQRLGVGGHGLLGRRSAQEVDLDGDASRRARRSRSSRRRARRGDRVTPPARGRGPPARGSPQRVRLSVPASGPRSCGRLLELGGVIWVERLGHG